MKTLKILLASLLLFSLLTVQAKEEEVAIPQSWGKLCGTLTTPDGGSDAAVLIIAGSGPTDRNCNSGSGLTTNAYLMLAQALEKNGIASLRYDKQGVGGSRYADPERYKQEDQQRFDDYITDAETLIAYLKQAGFKKIILAGHSEGSLIALAAAEKSADVTAVVSLAGAGYPIDEILSTQLNAQLMAYDPGMILKVQSILSQFKQGKTVDDIPQVLQTLFRPSGQPYLISWIKYDPRELIRRLQQPVLIINGDNDIQIAVSNADALAKAQPKARKAIIPGMTHLLKLSDQTDLKQQQVTIYMDASAPISEELVSLMTEFIRGL